jgi:hypothetical protein
LTYFRYGDLIVYGGTQVFTLLPLLAVHPDGTPAKLPEISVQRDGERPRILPDGSGVVYMLGSTTAGQDFWLLDLATMHSRRLTRLKQSRSNAHLRYHSRWPRDCVSIGCGKIRTSCLLILRPNKIAHSS